MMKTWKVLAGTALAVGAIALGPAACGDSTTNCTSASDCSGNTPACDTGCGLCYKTCTVATEATDCTGGEVCGALCAGSTTLACGTSGTGGSGGTGGAGGTGGTGGGGTNCTQNSDCVEQVGYCASTTSMCVGSNCGAEGNVCEGAATCTGGPNNGLWSTGAPVIFLVEQKDLDPGDGAVQCLQDPNCFNGQGYICSWTLGYTVPTGAADIAPSGAALWHATQVHLANGGYGDSYDVPTKSGNEVSFKGCFNMGVAANGLNWSVNLKNTDGQVSNTLCLPGTAP